MAQARTKASEAADRPPSPRAGRDLVILLGLAAALLLPFAGKAVHVDDPLFIAAAHAIKAHPLDPYGFELNWYGEAMPMGAVTKNPPLSSYYLATAAAAVGWSDVALHLAFLLPSLAATAGAYVLARRLCAHPLVAGLVTLLTPVWLQKLELRRFDPLRDCGRRPPLVAS